MELFSDSFKRTVTTLLDHPNAVVVATIPIAKGQNPFIERVRNRKDAKLFTVTRGNRDFIMEEILREFPTTL
jgi:nucleoside-triphosphatase THEP1